MNVRDSQWLSAALCKRGFIAGNMNTAEICILNTCSVREKPERKVLDLIGRIREANGNLQLLAVLGCVAQQLGETLFNALPQLRLVGGGDSMAHVPDAIVWLLQNPAENLAILDFSKEYRERELLDEELPGRSAFVNIMQGCDNFCSYCIVPFTRGRQKSRARQEILHECRRWLEKGAVEITLLGQNVNVWGDDKKDAGAGFASLLRDIAKLDGLERLRFVTPHPADMGPQIVACFGELDVLCPRLHLPLQAGSDTILAAMRRRHTRAEYLRLVADLRAARPDLALSTDLIVGFPGETEADFAETLDMMEKCAFMSSFSFCYSDRPGTRACLMPNKINPETKLQRLGRLQALQEKLTTDWLAQRAGTKTKMLVERKSPRGGEFCWQGRDPYGVCVNAEINSPSDQTGRMLAVEIAQAKKHSLVGAVTTS